MKLNINIKFLHQQNKRRIEKHIDKKRVQNSVQKTLSQQYMKCLFLLSFEKYLSLH